MAKKIAEMGVFVTLAMIFSYVEVLIPFHLGIPGVKLGIANLVIVVGLYLFPAKEVFGISIVRILLMGLLFGNGVSILYSLVGGILSFFVMLLCKKTSGLSVIGVSVAGGVSHNIGQILAAMVVLWNVRIVSYLPVLLVAGVLTGALNGFLSKKIARVLLHAGYSIEE